MGREAEGMRWGAVRQQGEVLMAGEEEREQGRVGKVWGVSAAAAAGTDTMVVSSPAGVPSGGGAAGHSAAVAAEGGAAARKGAGSVRDAAAGVAGNKVVTGRLVSKRRKKQ